MKQIFMILALLCAFAQGAWAQNEWDEVYALTQTTSANWTPLNAGSATGQTLGSAGATSYYYITGDLNFANSNAGGSGLTIQGTVYLYIPSGKTLATTGANASGQTGAVPVSNWRQATRSTSSVAARLMPRAATPPTAATAATAVTQNVPMMSLFSVAQVELVAMAAAVLVQASAHAAVTAASAATAANATVLTDKRPHNMASTAMPAVPVVLLALWAISMRSRPSAICQPREVTPDQTAQVAMEASPLPNTLAQMYIWHQVAVAVVPAASAVLPATSEPVALAVAVVAAAPLVMLPGWFTLEPQMVTTMQEPKAVTAAPMAITHRPPMVLKFG